MNIEPEKWRDNIDPFTIKYKNIVLKEVLGYPHARNDVLFCRGEVGGQESYFYIKIDRNGYNDIENEVNIINKLNLDIVPNIIEYSLDKPNYIITEMIKGERLSVILDENKELSSFDYIDEYTRYLSNFHKLKGDFPKVNTRKFFNIPEDEYFIKYKIVDFKEYLLNNMPTEFDYVFTHGDMHYANILWKGKKIVAILDYELSGIGIKEFDIAWSLFLRPCQKFFNTSAEIEYFLDSYSKYNSFNINNFYYYFVLIASYFYTIGDDKYKEEIRAIMPF